MGNAYFIRVGTFQAVLREDHLTEFPRLKFRRLLRLALTEPENRPVLETMGLDIRAQVADAKTAMDAAARDYQANWKHVANPRSKKPAIVKTVEENRRLKAAVRETKGRHANWVSIQAIFEKECS